MNFIDILDTHFIHIYRLFSKHSKFVSYYINNLIIIKSFIFKIFTMNKIKLDMFLNILKMSDQINWQNL